MRPARQLAEAAPDVAADGFVLEVGDRGALPIGEVEAGGGVPEVGVDGDGLGVVEGEEGNAVGELGADAVEGDEGGVGLFVGGVFKRFQVGAAASGDELAGGAGDGGGAVAKLALP